MADEIYPAVDLRTATMDLARRLSSLGHFLPAAHQLLTCEHLSSEDIDRHSRKIVTLIEVARSTLLRCHVRLYLFAACNPALAHHKEAYFNMLRMLRRMRPYMHDSSLNERICRLLLALSTSMHVVNVADAGDQAAASCSAEACRESLLSPRSPSPPPITVNYPTAHSGRPAGETMLPPDVLLSRPKKRTFYRDRPQQPEPVTPPRGRRTRRSDPRPTDEPMSLYDGIRELPAWTPKPAARRFGILFTMRRPQQRQHR